MEWLDKAKKEAEGRWNNYGDKDREYILRVIGVGEINCWRFKRMSFQKLSEYIQDLITNWLSLYQLESDEGMEGIGKDSDRTGKEETGKES